MKINCKLCSSGDLDHLQHGVRYEPEIDVFRCRACGIVFLDPFPNQEEIEKYYSEVYRGEYDSASFDETEYSTHLDEAKLRFHRMQDVLGPDLSLLEIGCGRGAFLDVVRPHVGRIIGVEPDRKMRIEIGRRLGLQPFAKLNDAALSPGSIDIITLFHVLEHIPYPGNYLRELCNLLKPGGKLIIEVPNVNDMLVGVYKVPAYLDFYYQKAHLYYFSVATLTTLLNEVGFAATVEGVQRYDFSNHIHWMLEGKPGGSGYYRDIFTPLLERAYADTLIQSGYSDTLWAVACKK